MKVHKFIFNDFRVITYLVIDEETSETVIIDPGCNKDSERKRLQHYVDVHGLKPKYVVNTHAHMDHICGNKYVVSEYDIPLIAHKKELENYSHSKDFVGIYGFEFEESPLPDEYLKEGDEIVFGSSKLHIIETPGHTAGSISLLSPEKEIIFSGDIIFQGSIGRTDLPGGDLDTLINTLKEKILTLPGDTIIFAGHGYETTVAEEMKNNPFIKDILQ